MFYFDVILLSDVISSIGPKISDADTNVQDKDKKVALVIVSIFPSKFMHCVCGFNKVWFSEAFVRLLL